MSESNETKWRLGVEPEEAKDRAAELTSEEDEKKEELQHTIQTNVEEIGGPAFGDRVALAITSAKRQVWIAMLRAGMNIPGAITIDVIVIYLIIANLATIPYTKWCKKQLVTQVKP
ncbi:MAG TPA: hypothetical protein VFR94_25575 [Nitrososphaeraceae archaeon]|nr:hypothetical protein [Nitrososphaeraceae archaeon]